MEAAAMASQQPIPRRSPRRSFEGSPFRESANERRVIIGIPFSKGIFIFHYRPLAGLAKVVGVGRPASGPGSRPGIGTGAIRLQSSPESLLDGAGRFMIR
jgi:hypothetical protein